MKILHLIYSAALGGAEKYLKHLLPGLKENGIECHLQIVCPEAAYELFVAFAKDLEQAGVPTHVFVASKFTLVGPASKIHSYCKRNEIKIIHSHLLNADIIAVLIKRIYAPRILLISTKHGYEERALREYQPDNYKKRYNLYYFVSRYLIKSIDHNISVSRGLADLFKDLGLTKKTFPVIHHGISIPVLNDRVIKRYAQQLIIVGRLEPVKGHGYLLEAMQIVLSKFPETKLLVIGEGSQRKNITEKIEQLSLNDSIDLLGFQSDPYSFIRSSDIVVLPSLFESFGLVYIESFALSVPIVAFDTPAGNEIMKQDITSLMVPKADKDALAAAIISLLSDEAERKRLAENAYQEYLEKYTTETMIENTAKWYAANLP